MADNKSMQADGGDAPSGEDGIEEAPGGKTGSESSGAAYPNPHSGEDEGGFDGGQSDKSYRGPDNPNATTE